MSTTSPTPPPTTPTPTSASGPVPTPKTATSQEEILKEALTSYGDEYKDLADTWKQLDQKAQGVTAIAGVFLAAVFAWARELPVGLWPVDRAALVLVVFLLASTMALALWSLRVRSSMLPPFGKTTLRLAKDCCREMQSDPTSVVRYYHELAATWEEANEEIEFRLKDKSHYAGMAQAVLGWAAAAACALTIVIVTTTKGTT